MDTRRFLSVYKPRLPQDKHDSFCPVNQSNRYMMFLFTTILFCGALTALYGEVVDSNPQPLDDIAKVVYPDDYCQNIKPAEQFDIIVVGAGPAGSAVARRMAEDPNLRVLLMEAGGNPPDESDVPGNSLKLLFDVRWNFTTTDTPQSCRGTLLNRCNYVSGRVLGGSSTVNFMMYTRGNKLDFDEWKALGNDGWGFDDVLPYFKKLENYIAQPVTDSQTNETVSSKYHQTGGPLTTAYFQPDPRTEEARNPIFEAAAAHGFKYNNDINGEDQMGFTNLPGMVNKLGYRQNTAKAYLLSPPDNLKICKNAIVTKVTFSGKTATGVEYWYPTNGLLAPFLPFPKSYSVKASKGVIISGGPLNSPLLLERSGVGQKSVLTKMLVRQVHELPGVGENFQDQFINLGAAFTVNYGTNALINPLSNELTSLTGFVNLTDPSSTAPDIQYILKTYDPLIGVGLFYKPSIQLEFANAGSDVLFFGPIILRQGQPGSIHSFVNDPRITPIVAPNQFATKGDIDINVAATRKAREIMQHPALAHLNPKPFILKACQNLPFNSEEEIMCMTRLMANTLYHLAGPCKMGPASDPMAVVDNKLKVHGMEKLWVIDSSIMPLVTRANTEIPAVMIGERGADLVKEALKM